MLLLFIVIILCSIILAIINIKENEKKQSAKNNQHYYSIDNSSKASEFSEDLEIYLWNEFHSNPIVNEHYSNIEGIKSWYSVVTKSNNVYSSAAENVISLCKRDISIAEKFVEIHKKYNQSIPPSYYSFKILALMYEKRNEYEKAIEVCSKAIINGFIVDGTKGGMYGRKKRLMKHLKSD